MKIPQTIFKPVRHRLRSYPFTQNTQADGPFLDDFVRSG